jgi:hypothetical protein
MDARYPSDRFALVREQVRQRVGGVARLYELRASTSQDPP